MHVTAITYSRYRVTTADDRTQHFWERNLRRKTDSSRDGPQRGAPALVPAEMMGDRGEVISPHPRRLAK